jgi:hypothetical protein
VGHGTRVQLPHLSVLCGAYVAQADWADAATECSFQPDEGTIKIRNMLDAQCLRNTARVTAQGFDPEQVVIDLTNILGVRIALRHYGFDPGPTDGAGGPRTTATVTAYQNAAGLGPTGHPEGITAALAVALTGEGFTAPTSSPNPYFGDEGAAARPRPSALSAGGADH